ncbi:MAG: JDVT-CTERM system CAAX-type protease, partial [Nitrospirota bacterium]|nr:JDVT-CTERM system CAAX-type protease [Nitrospirota bacterium]
RWEGRFWGGPGLSQYRLTHSNGLVSGPCRFWLPFVDELLFRGLIQEQLARCSWGRRAIHEVTLANCATSVLLMAGHWFTHPPLWALSVLIPSLIFGLVRDRLQSTYPSTVLHCFYNTGYFILAGV